MPAENRFGFESDGDSAVRASPSLHWTRVRGWSAVPEKLAVEAPLAIEIVYFRGGHELRKVLAVTMRTPGHDEDLALGFLAAEGLIAGRGEIESCTAATETAQRERIATQRIRLVGTPREDPQRVSRGLLTTSACGVCGRSSLAGLPLNSATQDSTGPTLSCDQLARLPERLRQAQATFFETGGSHAAALSDARSTLHVVREDVGRHNAVDKVFGAALGRDLDCRDKILVLSGRASFELVQKAAVAGVPVVVAVGAPSSLAVSFAHAAGITLIGFTREERFNVYTHTGRLEMGETPGSVLEPAGD